MLYLCPLCFLSEFDKLGVSVKALERWRALGEGPAVVRLTEKTLRYHLVDVEAFIDSRRTQKNTPDKEG